MSKDELSSLKTEEMKNLFILETRQFMEGIGNGIQLDDLKEIRTKLRKIEIELHKRGVKL
jgi:hypothetical protein